MCGWHTWSGVRLYKCPSPSWGHGIFEGEGWGQAVGMLMAGPQASWQGCEECWGPTEELVGLVG